METLLINHIYNKEGTIEYTIIPYYIWQQLEPYIKVPYQSAEKPKEIIFNPAIYRGILKPMKLNIEQELKEMRNQWNKDI